MNCWKARKTAKIRNRYIQKPYLTQDTTLESLIFGDLFKNILKPHKEGEYYLPWVTLQYVTVVFPNHTHLLLDIRSEYACLVVNINSTRCRWGAIANPLVQMCDPPAHQVPPLAHDPGDRMKIQFSFYL